MKLSRREFIKAGAAGSVALTAIPSVALAEPDAKPDVWIFQGKDPRALMKACMKTLFENGGFGENVKKLGFKPNIPWQRLPEQGVCTHPDLVDVFLEETLASGIRDIIIPERLKNKDEIALERNGVGPVLEKHKLKIIPTKAKNANFTTIEIPEAKSLKTVEVCSELLEADATVNMPVAKHHSGATMTITMKNWMGVVKDPRWWHGHDLHQCIADFSLFLKPTWSIVDATRCMTEQGPKGPSEFDPSIMIYPNEVILSRDPVAADAVATRHFHSDPHEVLYLTLAESMGIGVIDQTKMNIHTIAV
jgi:uncharacterized protein (DUF362 family)